MVLGHWAAETGNIPDMIGSSPRKSSEDHFGKEEKGHVSFSEERWPKVTPKV